MSFVNRVWRLAWAMGVLAITLFFIGAGLALLAKVFEAGWTLIYTL